MSNTLGKKIQFTLWGDSHGPAIGGVLDGLPGGIKIEEEALKELLKRRMSSSSYTTARKEPDHFQILSGVKEGYTTGSPILAMTQNTDVSEEDEVLKDIPRPSHSDYPLYVKEQGFGDSRGGGHFSGRLTAPVVYLGGILKFALEKKKIFISSKLIRLGGVDLKDEKLPEEILEGAKNGGDSLGAVAEVVVTGLEPGLGNPWFDSLESVLSAAIFAIPGIKGISFGAGFDLSDMTGSAANDEMRIQDGKVTLLTNNNGGILGGITNGMPLVFQVAIKPTPSISIKQNTVNLKTKENAVIEISGRNDVCFGLRLPVVLETMTALVLADELTQKYGEGYLR